MLFSKFLVHEDMDEDESSLALVEKFASFKSIEKYLAVQHDFCLQELYSRYDYFFQESRKGKIGGTTVYLATYSYIYLINRIYCALQNAVRNKESTVTYRPYQESLMCYFL